MRAAAFIATVFGVGAVVMLAGFARAKSTQISRSSAVIAFAELLLAVLWLSFASTYLFWVYPLAVVGSGVFGDLFGQRRATLTPSEFPMALVALAMSGVASVLIFSRRPDPDFGYLPTALLTVNYVVFIATAAIRGRLAQAHERAAARAVSETNEPK